MIQKAEIKTEKNNQKRYSRIPYTILKGYYPFITMVGLSRGLSVEGVI